MNAQLTTEQQPQLMTPQPNHPSNLLKQGLELASEICLRTIDENGMADARECSDRILRAAGEITLVTPSNEQSLEQLAEQVWDELEVSECSCREPIKVILTALTTAVTPLKEEVEKLEDDLTALNSQYDALNLKYIRTDLKRIESDSLLCDANQRIAELEQQLHGKPSLDLVATDGCKVTMEEKR